jgi:hypothetical protein
VLSARGLHCLHDKHQIQIANIHIVVHKAIAHPDNFMPWDFRVSFLESCRDVLRRLADGLKDVDQRQA